MVGTDIGNTYKGQQGTGFATIAPYNPQVDLSLLEMQQRKEAAAAAEKKAKEARLMAAYADLGKIKPDNWYVHDEAVSKMMSGLTDLGASYIARGIDPMNDPAAKDFQKLMTETARTAEYSKQFKDRFTQVQTAYKNGEEIDNWDEIATWFHNGDINGMVNGDYGKEPKPIFKKPEIDTQKVFFDSVHDWQKVNPERVPTQKDNVMIAEGIVANPKYESGFASANSKAKQRYEQTIAALPESERGKYDAKAARTGASSGFVQWLADQIGSVNNPDVSNMEIIQEAGRKAGTRETKVEKGDKTVVSTSIKASDDIIKKEISARLFDGNIERDVAAGIYGNPDWTADKNRKAAIEYYLPFYKASADTKYSETYDEAGKEGKKTEASFTNWYNDITSGDGDKFVAAAPYIDKEGLARFVPGMPKEGTVSNVKYYRSGRMEIDVIDKDGAPLFTKELKVTDIPKEMLKNAYMDQYKGTKRNYETTETGQQQKFNGSGNAAPTNAPSPVGALIKFNGK